MITKITIKHNDKRHTGFSDEPHKEWVIDKETIKLGCIAQGCSYKDVESLELIKEKL